MRISTGQQFDTQRRAISANYAEMARWQNQIASGRRIEKLSDDPFSSGVLLRQRTLRTQLEQFQTNLRVAKDYAGNSENALGEIHDMLRRAYTSAVQGANTTVEQTSRNGMAEEIGRMQERLIMLANSRGNDGQYLFAGRNVTQQPYQFTGTTITYSGDTDPVLIETGPNSTMRVNTPGGDPFIDAYNALEQLKVNLFGGNLGALSNINVAELQARRDQFSRLRSDAGAVMRQVTELEINNRRRMDELTEGISTIEDVDISEAVAELKRTEVAYQASLQTMSMSFRLSLLDYMR